MKWLKGIRASRLVGYVGTAMIYPVYALISSGGRMIRLIDGMTIVGLVLVIMGVVMNLVRHGDFDIFEYVTRRSASSMRNEQIKPFAAFREDKEERRAAGGNYPLVTGLLMLIASGILAAFFY